MQFFTQNLMMEEDQYDSFSVDHECVRNIS